MEDEVEYEVAVKANVHGWKEKILLNVRAGSPYDAAKKIERVLQSLIDTCENRK